MFSKIKLRTKIFGGFTIILLLTLFVAEAGHIGLSRLVGGIEDTRIINSLVKDILTVRIDEKKYLLSGEHSQGKRVLEEISALISRIEILPLKKNKSVNIDSLKNEMFVYLNSLRLFISQGKKKDDLLTSMNEGGGQIRERLIDIRNSQKNQVGVAMEMCENLVSDKMKKTRAADRMTRLIMELRTVGVSAMNQREDSAFARCKSVLEEIARLSGKLHSELLDHQHIQYLENTIDNLNKYAEKLEQYVAKGDEAFLKDLIISEQSAIKNSELLHQALMSDLEKVQNTNNNIIELKLSRSKMAENMMAMFQRILNDKDKLAIEKKFDMSDEILEKIGSFKKAGNNLIKELKSDKNSELLKTSLDLVQSFQASLLSLIQIERKRLQTSRTITNASQKAQKICENILATHNSKLLERIAGAKNIIRGGTAAAVIAGILLSLFLGQGIAKPLEDVVLGMNRIAGEITRSSREISLTSNHLSEGAMIQASSIEQTSSSLEELSATVRRNAEQTVSADSLMSNAAQSVKEANNAMKELTSAMEDIIAGSERIWHIIKNIEDIAFQTNLLALNAMIEAARAKEAGNGFTVVAGEVKNLSENVSRSAEETTELIEKTIRKIQKGETLLKKSNDSYANVLFNTEKAVDVISEIASASREQAHGIEHINKAVSEIDRITQENADTSRETAEASEIMKREVKKMKSLVRSLSDIIEKNRKKD